MNFTSDKDTIDNNLHGYHQELRELINLLKYEEFEVSVKSGGNHLVTIRKKGDLSDGSSLFFYKIDGHIVFSTVPPSI